MLRQSIGAIAVFFVPFVCAAQEPLGDAREVPGVPDIVLDAAKSRLFKPGGCDSLRPGRAFSDFFPAVDFWVLRCELEHGGPSSAVIGQDSQTVYLLDSAEDYAFLVLRHPVQSILVMSNPAEYFQSYLKLSGVLPWDAQPATEAVLGTMTGECASVRPWRGIAVGTGSNASGGIGLVLVNADTVYFANSRVAADGFVDLPHVEIAGISGQCVRTDHD